MGIYGQVIHRARQIAVDLLEGIELPEVESWQEAGRHFGMIYTKGEQAILQAAAEVIKNEEDARAFLNELLAQQSSRRGDSGEDFDIQRWFTRVCQSTGTQFGGNPWSGLAGGALRGLPQYKEASECVRQNPSPFGMVAG